MGWLLGLTLSGLDVLYFTAQMSTGGGKEFVEQCLPDLSDNKITLGVF